MKFECSVEKLKLIVTQVEKIIRKNNTLPILNSVLLVTDGNKVTLRATNLDVGVEVSIPAKVQEQGSVAIAGTVLSSFISSVNTSGNIIFTEDNGNIAVSFGSNNSIIKCFPVDDFPTLPTLQEDSNLSCFSVKLSYLLEGISSVVYSASLSDIKPELSSVYIYKEEGALVFVATDSFRLAEKKIKIKNNTDVSGIIIPFKNAVEIMRFFTNEVSEVEFCFNKNQLSIKNEALYFTSRIIDGVFPDYKQIIPKESKTEVVILKQDIIDALKLSNIFANKFNKISINISTSDKKFEINTDSSEVGNSDICVDAAISGEDLSINLNYKYIIDCLQSINSDSVVFMFNGENKPVIIKAVGDNSFTYLIMPMNK